MLLFALINLFVHLECQGSHDIALMSRHRSVMLVMEHTGEPLVDSVLYFSV